MEKLVLFAIAVCVITSNSASQISVSKKEDKGLSSSSSSSRSSSSSSSSSSGSSSFHVKVEEHESKSDNKGTYEVTKVYERTKPESGNETSNSQTVVVIRYPNGTTKRKVTNNGPTMEVKCSAKEDCPANKYCNKLSYQCHDCIPEFGCFSDEQCCGDKFCNLGTCKAKPVNDGLEHSTCRRDSDCKDGLYCSYNLFDGGVCLKLKAEGQSCNRGMFGDRRKCADGLECKHSGGFPFFNYKCLKEGSVQHSSTWADSPFGWFNARSFFDDEE